MIAIKKVLSLQERKVVQEEMEKMEAKHRQHEKLKHPMTKDQLEEVWEEQDHMEAKVREKGIGGCPRNSWMMSGSSRTIWRPK